MNNLSIFAENIIHVISNFEEHTLEDIESKLSNTSGNLVKVEIKCQGNSSLFLPIPIISSKFQDLRVCGCLVKGTDQYRNFSGAPDNVLRHLVFSDVIFELSEYNEYLQIVNWEQNKHLFQYGWSIVSASLMTFRETNVSYVYKESFQMDHQYLDKLLKYREYLRVHKTNYNLIYLEISNSKEKGGATNMKYYSINDFLESGRFPFLQVMNFSGLGLQHLPEAIRKGNWWWAKFPSLIHIDFSYNRFERIPFIVESFSSETISVNLRDNAISFFSDKELLRVYPLEIDLTNNKFDCHCSKFVDEMITATKTFNLKFKKYYRYLANATCYHPVELRGKKISNLNVSKLCYVTETLKSYSALYLNLIIMLSVALFVFFLIVVISKYRKELHILSYTRLRMKICKPVIHVSESSLMKEYDAFLSYSHQDAEWVNRVLIPKLTESPAKLKLCLHERDFKLGGFISDNIIESIDNSRHTIMIISEAFLASKWCGLEFKTAFHQNLMEKNRHLIAVLMDGTDLNKLDNDMRRYLETHTFLKQNELLFWDKLIYALSELGGNKEIV
ncbi:toll-like receptor 2 type-2 [Saccostrea echinata]|uniref:toll-like receptor 2 type-2 n=1 Tax=Saccostrea echinata TaxID=191078 RepID=UPI002A814B92|nr:toll-like receptor 2 type-2 [Saccostrea echinata]